MKAWMYKPWSHIESRIMPVTESGCWLWTGATTAGYGYTSWQGKVVRVHRLIYEHYKGPIPKGLFLDHLCRIALCCNPDHLEPVTNRQNLGRGIGKSAHAIRTDTCKSGHVFTKENTYFYNGCRHCRTCTCANQRAYNLRLRQKGIKPKKSWAISRKCHEEHCSTQTKGAYCFEHAIKHGFDSAKNSFVVKD